MEIPQLADLLDLQAVDLEIDRLLDQRQSLPALDRYRATSVQGLAAGESRDEVAGRQRVLGLDLDRQEGELEIIEIRLKEAETRLFAGGMNARETEHKRLEVRSLQGQQEALEEKVLGLLDDKEKLDGSVAEAEAEVERLVRLGSELEAEIAAAWKVIDLELGRKEARKAEMVPPIPSDLLMLYEQLRRTKEGVAVGRLTDGQCGGCHLHLSLPEQEEAKQTDPPRCVHCRRILVI